MARLKVYRTAIGFHDAYVAAPSQKAALQAWGSDADLFARGLAEQVDDPALGAEPLARPGQVVKRLRGTAAEQLAALPPDRLRTPLPPHSAPEPERPANPRARAATPRSKPKPQPKPKPPRPDRGALDAAEAASAAAAATQRREDEALAAEERALAERRRTQRTAHAAQSAALKREQDRAQAALDAAMARWRAM